MTWAELLAKLQNMAACNHESMDRNVNIIVDGIIYELDIVESLTTGQVICMPAIVSTEEEADG